jgi:hypothetical protein
MGRHDAGGRQAVPATRRLGKARAHRLCCQARHNLDGGLRPEGGVLSCCNGTLHVAALNRWLCNSSCRSLDWPPLDCCTRFKYPDLAPRCLICILQLVPSFLQRWVERAKALQPGRVPGYDADFRALLDAAAGICSMEE